VPDIRITVAGRPALTTEQAALRHGRGLSQMRTLFARYKIEPVAYLNPRMALYDEEQVSALTPVGQGKGGGRKRSES
jgi:hypothetical protein